MSNDVLNWAWGLELPPAEKLVLIALADRADNKGGSCFPGQADISKRTGQHRSTVSKCVRSLEKKGVLVITQRPVGDGKKFRRANSYRLNCGVQLHLNVATDDIYTSPNATHNPQVEPPIEPSFKDSGKPHLQLVKTSEKENQKEIKTTGENWEDGEVTKISDVIGKEPEYLNRDWIIADSRKRYKAGSLIMATMWQRLYQSQYGVNSNLSVKEKSILKKLLADYASKIPMSVDKVFADWIGFGVEAQKMEGAFNIPQRPTVSFYKQYLTTAVAYNKKPLKMQLTAPNKALTNPPDQPKIDPTPAQVGKAPKKTSNAAALIEKYGL
jgi:hypothetical protein